MRPEYLNEVLAVIDTAKRLGERILSNGTRLIGNVPHVAPEARFHLVFSPLEEREINYIEKKLGNNLPIELREFYYHHNGISLFSGALSIYGLRRNFNRTGDNAWQPFDILVTNEFDSTEDFRDTDILIGGYKQDGSRLYADCITSKVYRCARESSRPLNEWHCFSDMLLNETKRLSELFDENGKKKNPALQTIPDAPI